MTNDAIVSVIDDDVAILQSLESLLRGVGYRVALFVSAEAFLLAEPRASDCVVADLHLQGGMDGLALAQLLRDRAATMILMSGRMRGDVAVKARAMGIRHVLRKPFDSELMIRCIEDTLRRGAS